MTATDSRPRHLPALDGLRAVAILLVMVFHTNQDGVLSGGFLGVDLFFVLSGFLITSQLLKPNWTLKDFMARRLARLWPGLLAVAAFSAAVVLAGGGSLGAVITSPLYIYNELVAYHAPLGDDTLLAHTWSLSIEVQFYVLWAAAMWWLRRRGAPPRVVARLALVAAATSFAVKVLYAVTLDDGWRAYFATESRLDGLLIGSALAALLVLPTPALGQLARPALPVTALIVCLFTADHYGISGVLLGGPVAILVAACVVIAAVQVPDSHWLVPLAWTPAVALGQRSYSLYLWHQPVFAITEHHTPLDGAALVLTQWLVAFAVSLASYSLLESPARRYLYRQIARPRPETVSTPSRPAGRGSDG